MPLRRLSSTAAVSSRVRVSTRLRSRRPISQVCISVCLHTAHYCTSKILHVCKFPRLPPWGSRMSSAGAMIASQFIRGVIMATVLNPYISFRGTAREAMEFYQSAFGGELTVTTFGDYNITDRPEHLNDVMHSRLIGEAGIVLMA